MPTKTRNTSTTRAAQNKIAKARAKDVRQLETGVAAVQGVAKMLAGLGHCAAAESRATTLLGTLLAELKTAKAAARDQAAFAKGF